MAKRSYSPNIMPLTDLHLDVACRMPLKRYRFAQIQRKHLAAFYIALWREDPKRARETHRNAVVTTAKTAKIRLANMG